MGTKKTKKGKRKKKQKNKQKKEYLEKKEISKQQIENATQKQALEYLDQWASKTNWKFNKGNIYRNCTTWNYCITFDSNCLT